MSYKSKTKILIGKEAKRNAWGKIGESKGMYTGGHNSFYYGVKGLIAYTKYEAWGDMTHDNPNLK